MKVLIVAATRMEIEPLWNYLDVHFQQKEVGHFFNTSNQIKILITGVGQAQMAYALGVAGAKEQHDLWLNAGIAGAYHSGLALGEVVSVQSQTFGDLGVEEADGRFLDAHEINLIPKDDFPFSEGKLLHPSFQSFSAYQAVHGLTVNRVTGTPQSIQAIRAKYPEADIETMEGAAFFYAALLQRVAFMELKSISNYVEPRNKSNWVMGLAIRRLNEQLINLFQPLVN